MQKARGFTLVELIITIAVAAVLVTVAVPSFSNTLAGWRLTNVTNEMIAAVHLSRSEAVRLNRGVSLCRAATATATSCSSAANWGHWIVLGNDVVRRGSPENVSSAISVSSNFTNDTITYGPNGLPNASGTITVCTSASIPDNARTISVGPGTRVSVDRSGDCS